MIKFRLLHLVLILAALTAALSSETEGQILDTHAVGYLNLVAPEGFSIIANPLNNPPNHISDIFQDVPSGFTLYKMVQGSFAVNTFDALLGWSDPDQTLSPGEAAFVFSPTTVPLTFVGMLLQGTIQTELFPGFNLVSSVVPRAGALQTTLNYLPGPGDTVYRLINGQYLIYSYEPELGWDEEPQIEAGEGFFLYRTEPGIWETTFVVN